MAGGAAAAGALGSAAAAAVAPDAVAPDTQAAAPASTGTGAATNAAAVAALAAEGLSDIFSSQIDRAVVPWFRFARAVAPKRHLLASGGPIVARLYRVHCCCAPLAVMWIEEWEAFQTQAQALFLASPHRVRTARAFPSTAVAAVTRGLATQSPNPLPPPHACRRGSSSSTAMRTRCSSRR